MMKRLLLILLAVILPSTAKAVGGPGSTCDPSVAAWSTCTKVTIPWASSVPNTVNVAGGTWSSAYTAGTSGTRYVLQGNVTANGTGINITASYVIIDLNGYTLTYNQTTQGEGVRISASNINHIAVVNGSIVQGAAKSAGSIGYGSAPLTSSYLSGASETGLTYIHIANVYVKRTGYDVAGILFPRATGTIVEQTTSDDAYYPGTVGNRHSGVPDAINPGAKESGHTVRYCTIINARHRGINIGDNPESSTMSYVYGNKISLRSLDTNAAAVASWNASNLRIYDNTIQLAGNHPVGIANMGSESTVTNVWGYNNYIYGQRTAVCGDASGNTATGIRIGAYKDSADVFTNFKYFNNEIDIQTFASYTGQNCATGAVLTGIDARGKGIFTGPAAGSFGTFENNKIKITGDGDARGISPMVNNEDNIFFIENRVETSYANVMPADDYNGFKGWPLFLNNTFIKNGARSDYRTFLADGWEAYNTGSDTRFVGSIYQNGASADSYSFDQSGTENKAYFGHMEGGVPKYDYLLSKSGSSTIKTTYSTPITLAYAYPASCNEWSKLCTTQTACNTNWPGYTWTGSVCAAPSSGGSDVTAPTVTTNVPTTASTYNNGSVSTISISGAANDNVGIGSVSWSCPSCTPSSGIASGTTAWSFGPVTLSGGTNNVTVVALDTSSNSGQDTLAVTYTSPVTPTGGVSFGTGTVSYGTGIINQQ